MDYTQKLEALFEQIGLDIKFVNDKIGGLSSLTTTSKASIVAALNELKTTIASVEAAALQIDDSTTSDSTTYSSDKIVDLINAAIAGVVDGAPTALDTLKELADVLADSESEVAALVTALDHRVRFDAAQSLSTGEKSQARANIGAVAQSDIDSAVSAVQSDVDALEAQVSDLEASLSSASGDVSALDGRLTDVEADVASLQSDVANKAESSTVTTLAGRVTTTESDIAALQSAVSTAESDIDALESTVAGLASSGSVSDLEDRVSQVESDTSYLLSTVVRVNEAQSFSNGEKSQARTNIGAAAASDLTTLEGRVTTAEGEIDTLQSDASTAASAISALEGDVDTLQTDVAALVTALGDLDEDFLSAYETARGTLA